jgi:hypothetical protein
VGGGDRPPGPEPADADHLWFTHDQPLREAQFLAVIVPYRADAEPPVIEAAGEAGARVSLGGQTRTFSFVEADGADFTIIP